MPKAEITYDPERNVMIVSGWIKCKLQLNAYLSNMIRKVKYNFSQSKNVR